MPTHFVCYPFQSIWYFKINAKWCYQYFTCAKTIKIILFKAKKIIYLNRIEGWQDKDGKMVFPFLISIKITARRAARILFFLGFFNWFFFSCWKWHFIASNCRFYIFLISSLSFYSKMYVHRVGWVKGLRRIRTVESAKIRIFNW